MAKNQKKKSGAPRMSPAEKKQAEARAREDAKRAENARKSRMMGNVFLYAVLSIIAVFFVYTVICSFFFSARSVSELRSNYLFISLAAIPYLIAAFAIVTRKLRKKQRDEASANIRKAENLVFLIVLVSAILMFGSQMLTGRRDASQHPAFTAVSQTLSETGMEVKQEDEIPGFRSMLETMSLQTELRCGETGVNLQYHDANSFIAGRFRRQLGLDYAGSAPDTEENGGVLCQVWPVEADGEVSRSAVWASRGGSFVILELKGPAAETEALLPLLKQTAVRILGG